jgi:hypothetical protein
VTPEIGELLDKARDCLARAHIILAAGVGEDAGRDAYLAGFHAAQAVLRARTRALGEPPRRTGACIACCRSWRGRSRSLPTSPCFCRKPTT